MHDILQLMVDKNLEKTVRIPGKFDKYVFIDLGAGYAQL